MTQEYQPLVWRGSYTNQDLDQALPAFAYWHEHAFSDYRDILFLISVSPVGVELVARDVSRRKWHPGLAHLKLLEGQHFTALLSRLHQRAEMINMMFKEHPRG